MKDDKSLKEQTSEQSANAKQNEEATGVFVVGIGKAAAEKIAAAITKSLAPALARAIIEAFGDMPKTEESEEDSEISTEDVKDLKKENRLLREENTRLKNERPKKLGQKNDSQGKGKGSRMEDLPYIGGLFREIGDKR